MVGVGPVHDVANQKHTTTGRSTVFSGAPPEDREDDGHVERRQGRRGGVRRSGERQNYFITFKLNYFTFSILEKVGEYSGMGRTEKRGQPFDVAPADLHRYFVVVGST